MDRELDEALGELERLLEEETEALRKLDHSTIDRITVSKLVLCEKLGQRAVGKSAEKADLERIQRIKKLSLYNQVLLVHARDSVRGVLALLTGDSHGGSHPQRDGLRLSVRV
ncbi:MAG TPA: hypothetical protein VHE30_06955 [Polyangiaceae bacterium]|nr:hypothetical protein [Polyangiaceae bacterium]